MTVFMQKTKQTMMDRCHLQRWYAVAAKIIGFK